MADNIKAILEADGENKPVRCFLMAYGTPSLTVGAMQAHMGYCGYPYWPEWVEQAPPTTHLTKAGAQLWLRHLFSLESAARALAQGEPGEAVATVQVMGSYKGIPALGCLIDYDATHVKAGDKLYLSPTASAPAAEREPTQAEIVGAVARGWCHPMNSKKEMDAELALAISDEVCRLIGIGTKEPTNG